MKKKMYVKLLAAAMATVAAVGMAGVPSNERINVKAEEVTTVKNGESPTTKTEETTNKNIIKGKCGNEVKYAYDLDTKEVRVTGKGEMWDGMIINEIEDAKKVIIEDGVTSVGGWNFNRCNNTIDLEIPTSLKEIHSNAFNSVKKVVFQTTMDEVYSDAFSKIDTVEFKTDVIGFDADSFSADKVILHGSAQELAKAMIGSCDCVIAEDNNKLNVKSNMIVSADGKILYLMYEYKDYDKLVIPDTIVKIQPYVFKYGNINELKLGENVEEIGESAFESCSLKKLTLNKKIKSIGDYAFAYNKLKNVAINTGIKVGYEAFDSKVTFKYACKFKKMRTMLSAYDESEKIKIRFNKISGVKNYEITIKQGKKKIKYQTTKNNLNVKMPASIKSGIFTITVRGYKTVKNKKVYTKISNVDTLEKE